MYIYIYSFRYVHKHAAIMYFSEKVHVIMAT